MNGRDEARASSGRALLPFAVFIGVYLGSGVYFSIQGINKPFGQFPALISAYLAAVTAFLMHKGKFQEKFDLFLAGIARHNIIVMLIIFMLAGAFAESAEAMGGVDSIVNLCLTIIPHRFIIMGIFLIGCVVSFASGSSIGTAVTVAPIALGLAKTSGINFALVAGAVLSGGVFGNQLSPISDCSIAVVSGMGISTKDKSRYNLIVAAPAFILTILVFMVIGGNVISGEVQVGSYNLIKILPYIVVLGCAIFGIHVSLCLTLGILLAGIIGVAYGEFSVIAFVQSASNGAIGMGSTINMVIVMSGVSYMVDKMGGINFIIDKLLARVAKSSRSAHIGIALLTALIMFCVANDTVAIIVACPLAVDICNRFHLDPRKAGVTVTVVAASISPLIPWSNFSFTMVGMVEQAGGSISIVDTFPVTYYPLLLILCALAFALIPKLSSKVFSRPWDFDKKTPEEVV